MRQEFQNMYPVTIVKDRYGGCYSGALYTAWNEHRDKLPPEIDSSDVPCAEFWEDFQQGSQTNDYGEQVFCGKGHSPDEAEKDLFNYLRK